MLVLIFLVGCNGAVIKGPAGVDIGFSHPQDNSQILSTYELSPTIHIENKGDSDAEGTICIFGLDKTLFSGFPGCECQPFGLTLDEEELSVTTAYKEDFIMFSPLTLDDFTEDKKYGMSGFVKYDYKTYANSTACIKEQIYSDSGCRITSDAEGESLNVKSSIAPIMITNIRQRVYPKTEDIVDMLFMVDLQNKGTGQLFDSSYTFTRSCETPEYTEETIIVKMVDLPYKDEVFCGNVQLDEMGKGTAYCEVQDYLLTSNSGESLFAGKDKYIVNFIAEYSYRESSSTSFSIVEANLN